VCCSYVTLHLVVLEPQLLKYMLGIHVRRASLDWERVRLKASEIVEDLANRAPELTSLVVLPGGSMFPHDVLPIGFGYADHWLMCTFLSTDFSSN
jgi:hypothetical protein